MYVKNNLKLWLTVFALAIPLLFVGTASAMYFTDGAASDPTGNAGWITPNDMVCITGVHLDGTLDIAAGVTNARDCIYYTSGLTGMTMADVSSTHTVTVITTGSYAGSYGNCKGQTAPSGKTYVWDFVNSRCLDVTACSGTDATTKGTLTWNAGDSKCYDSAACTVAGATGNNGAKHALATTICVDGSGNGISLKDLDRTFAMCAAKGGTWKQTSDGIITSGSGTSQTASLQVSATAGFGGACIAYGRQFKGQDANGAPLAIGATKGTDAATAGYCYASMDWSSVPGYAAATCPSRGATVAPFNANAAYDWAVSGTKCTYAKSIAGNLNSALTKADGTTYAAASYIDLSTFTTMGDCLANGGSWNNWVGQAASITTVSNGTNNFKRPNWDYTRQAPDADRGCLHCHSTLTQYNGPAERWKDSYLKTGHKNMLRKATAGKKLVGPDGVAYTTDGTNAINFMTSTDPYAKITVSGVDQNLYYVYGDWMIALPTVIYGKNGYGSAPTGTTTDNNGYSCYACHTTGASDNTNPGVQSIGTVGYAGTEPANSFPNLLLNAANPKWDLDGIQCSRCHNASVGPVTAAQISASTFTTTAPTNGGMGALAAGTGRTNLCFGCHQGIDKVWPAGTANTTDPTAIPTGVSHGAAPGRDFNGHVLGNSFLNSVHANYTGTITLNSLGKYDLTSPSGTTQYNSKFKGYTCWQSPTTNSPAKTKADGTEIKTKAECEALYGAGSWRADQDGSLAATSIQGTCTTCHDVHNSLFVAGQEDAAIRKTCIDCHVNNASTGATDAAAPQVVLSAINHPSGNGTPFDTALYGNDPCAVCHMAVQAVTNGDQNSMPAHVWRISTDANYNTFPTTAQFYGGSCSVHAGTVSNAATAFVSAIYASDLSSAACTTTSVGGTWTATAKTRSAQTAPDVNTNAVWVDLDMACGQCHGGSGGPSATHNSAPYASKAALATAAATMHSGSALPPPATCSTPVASNSGVTQTGYTVSFTDNSTDTGDTSNLDVVTVNWGDGTATSTGKRGNPFTHTYTGTRVRSVNIVHMVRSSCDSNLVSKDMIKKTVPMRYNVTGTVFQSNGSTALTNAYVYLKLGTHTRQIKKAASGAFTFTNVAPGSYTIHVYKSGATFGADVPVTVSAGDAVQNVNAITP